MSILKWKNFCLLSFTTVWEQKIGFNSCECKKILNIANFYAFHVWGKRALSCNDTPVLLHFFCLCNASFFYSGYVIKPPQPSSAIYGTPPFTGHPFLGIFYDNMLILCLFFCLIFLLIYYFVECSFQTVSTCRAWFSVKLPILGLFFKFTCLFLQNVVCPPLFWGKIWIIGSNLCNAWD